VAPLKHKNWVGNFSKILNLKYGLNFKRKQNLTLRAKKTKTNLDRGRGLPPSPPPPLIHHHVKNVWVEGKWGNMP